MGEKNDKPNSMDVQIEVLRIRSPSIVLSKFPGILQLYSHETPTYTHVYLYVYFFFAHVYQFLPTFSSIFYQQIYPPHCWSRLLSKKKHIPKNTPGAACVSSWTSITLQRIIRHHDPTFGVAFDENGWSKTHGDEKLCRPLCFKKYLELFFVIRF